MSRLSEVLGVKEKEYFTVENSDRKFKLSGNKIHEYTSFGTLMIATDMDTLIWLIENSEKIKAIPSKPQLSKQQVTAIKGRIAEGWQYIARDGNDEILFFKQKPEYDEWSEFFDMLGDYNIATLPIYEFIKTGECLYLPDLIGGAENE